MSAALVSWAALFVVGGNRVELCVHQEADGHTSQTEHSHAVLRTGSGKEEEETRVVCQREQQEATGPPCKTVSGEPCRCLKENT